MITTMMNKMESTSAQHASQNEETEAPARGVAVIIKLTCYEWLS